MSDKVLQVGADNLEETIARMRQNDPTLTEFEYYPFQGPQADWSNVDVQAKHLTAIADAFAHNYTVKKFRIPNCDVKGARAGRILQRLLSKSRGLEDLDVTCTKLGVEGMTELCKGLSENTTLGAIGFTFAEMCDEGAKHFAEALRKNKSLKAFHLRNNSITDEGISAICDALMNNTTLETLDLSHCSMRAVGAKEGKDQAAYRKLCDLIRTNRTIVNVNLSFMPFSAQRNDISELGRAIAQNKSVANLRMECWALFPDSFKKFTAAMKGNKSLATFWGEDLNHSYTEVTAQASVNAMAAAMNDNPNFVRFYHGVGDETDMNGLLAKNQQAAKRLIAKIEDPKAKLTAEDARQIKASIHGLYYAADQTENKRLDGQQSYWSDNSKAAKVYAEGILAAADKKCVAGGFGKLSIPDLYKPAAETTEKLKPFVPAKTKVDLTKLKPETVTAQFKKSAGAGLAGIAYRAASAGQVDELMDYLAAKGMSLGAKECLYKPGKDEPTLIDLVAA